MATAPQPVTERRHEAQGPAAPSPVLFFETIRAFQQSAALKAAIDLDIFTAIAEGAGTVDAIANRTAASPRGVRIVSDYLVVLCFLTKEDGRYALTHDSFMFLNLRSPAYIGSAVNFLFAPEMLDPIRDFTRIVREGTSPVRSLDPDNPMWVNFAESMAPLMAIPAQSFADVLNVDNAGAIRVLDIAAGHGLFGVTIGRRNPAAHIVAVDWNPVLEVAKRNAAQAGLGERYQTIAGDARKVDVGNGYDLVLLPNFLHHFDQDTIVAFLGKMRGVLKDGGRVALFEFVPNEDRTGTPQAVAFPVTMLAMTPAGDAYTFGQYQRMLDEAGFRDVRLHQVPPAVQQAIVAVK